MACILACSLRHACVCDASPTHTCHAEGKGKKCHLLLHALQLVSRLFLQPLPLRRLLDDLVLRGVRRDRGPVLYLKSPRHHEMMPND